MPAEIFPDNYSFLKKDQLLTFAEIERLARQFARLGVTKLRLTGGEPLLRKDLSDLITRLVAIPGIMDIALTTNGHYLARDAAALKAAGLQRITISLDSLDADVFARMNGRGYNPERVLEGIAAAEKVGLQPIKLNVVVQRGVNDHTLLDIVRRFKATGLIVRFIEYMDVGTRNGWEPQAVVPSAQILAMLSQHFKLIPLGKNYHGEVAERYAFADGSGEIGFISSVTQPFCGGCSRARLSADGELFTCLFAVAGFDLRKLLRSGASDDEIFTHIQGIWQSRRDRYSEERAGHPDAHPKKVEMYFIGG